MAALLRVCGETRGLYDSIAYRSPHDSRVEVDFVLRRWPRLVAIEEWPIDTFLSNLAAGTLWP